MMNQKTYDFILTNCDTDSISFCKQDGSVFSKEETDNLLNEINSLISEKIQFEDDGNFPRVIISKAKNYVLLDSKGKLKIKGSSLTDSKKEPALTEMLKELINSLIYKENKEVEIYHKYIKEALNIRDINRWAVKKSITKKLLEGTRKNETKVLDAIDSSFREGDKVWLYNAIDGEIQDSSKGELKFYKDGRPKMIPNEILVQVKNWNGNENKLHYVGRVYATLCILENVLDMTRFIDYSLNKNKGLLYENL